MRFLEETSSPMPLHQHANLDCKIGAGRSGPEVTLRVQLAEKNLDPKNTERIGEG